MITPTQLYWITRLDAIDHLLGGFSILALLAPLILGVVGGMMIDIGPDDTVKNKGRRLIRLMPLSIITALLLLVINTFIPTTKEMAAIIVIPRVANSESVQQLGKGVVDLANQWLVELAPKHGEGEGEAGNENANKGGTNGE